jgi:tRNA pseudouridine38-40 synthase
MKNLKLTIQYDGSGFAGYELQLHQRTVRAELEKALFKLFKKKIKLVSSSRTDAGVHAVGSVISFSVPQIIPVTKIAAALNALLPEDIRVIKAQAKAKAQGFNARFDAKSKIYEYLIYNGQFLPPHIRNLVWHVKPKLNLAAMRKAAKYFIGKHDFSSFCASGGDDTNFVRIVHQLGIRHSSLGIWQGFMVPVISIRVKGNGFLYKMVRNMVGTLVEVGLGKRETSEVKKILLAKDRRLAGRCAPGKGLCLVKVNY